MKLYNITSTERTSKGQGGNNFLRNDIYIENKEKARYTTIITSTEDGYTIELYNNFMDKNILVYSSTILKSKK